MTKLFSQRGLPLHALLLFKHNLGQVCPSAPICLFLFGMQVFDLTRPSPMSKEVVAAQRLAMNPAEITNFCQLGEFFGKWLDTLPVEKRDFSYYELLDMTGIKKGMMADYLAYLHKDFRTWKVEMKLERVMSLLLSDESLSIAEAAREMGFRDMSNFHRQFKKFTGSSPREWKYNNFGRVLP